MKPETVDILIELLLKMELLVDSAIAQLENIEQSELQSSDIGVEIWNVYYLVVLLMLNVLLVDKLLGIIIVPIAIDGLIDNA